MTESLAAEVLIVGAGPTGLTTANYLGLCGIRVLVVERNESTVGEPRAVSIDDESLRTMQAIGLIERLKPKIVLGYGARYYSPGQKEFARVRPATQEYGYPRRSAFRQPELEALLLEGLDRFPNVEVLFEHDFERFEQDGDGVTAHVRGPGGKERDIRASFMAACDGGRSSIRKALGSELKGSSFEERWLVFDLENNTDDTPDSIAYCDHRRPAITLPGPEKTRRWEFLLKNDEDAEAFVAEDNIRALLKPYIGDLQAEVIRSIVYTFHARVADKWRKDRVFLLGDAAHLTPPYAGQGMNSGQRDAMNFAWKTAAVVKGQLGASVLESYEAERRDHARSLIQMAIQIGWVMVPRNWPHTYGQIAFFKIAGIIPPLRDYFLSMKFKPEPRFRNGFLTADDKPEKRTLVGRMLPQPDVTDETGAVRKLDDILGQGFSLLALKLDADTAFAGLDQPIWTRLNASKVVLMSNGAPSASPEGIPIVVDREGSFERKLGPYRNMILLVRPDRYVAAAFAPEAAAKAANEITLAAGIVDL